MKTEDLKVGDSVYFLSLVRHMRSSVVQVTKVGRKWIELSNGTRVERGDVMTDNRGIGGSDGRVYADEAAYHLWITRRERWNTINHHLRNTWQLPCHITDQDLSDLERIFQIDAQGS